MLTSRGWITQGKQGGESQAFSEEREECDTAVRRQCQAPHPLQPVVAPLTHPVLPLDSLEYSSF